MPDRLDFAGMDNISDLATKAMAACAAHATLTERNRILQILVAHGAMASQEVQQFLSGIAPLLNDQKETKG